MCGSGAARLQVSSRSGGRSDFTETCDSPLLGDMPICAGALVECVQVVGINRVQACVNQCGNFKILAKGDTSEASTVLGGAQRQGCESQERHRDSER